jgi:hypothetical protein
MPTSDILSNKSFTNNHLKNINKAILIKPKDSFHINLKKLLLII